MIPFCHVWRAVAAPSASSPGSQPFCGVLYSMMARHDAALLAPDAAAAYGNDVLVHTAGGDSYTASRADALRLLHDLGLHQQAAIYPRVANLINPITPLQVTRPLGAVFACSDPRVCHPALADRITAFWRRKLWPI